MMVFGVRHFSPAAALHLTRLLDELQPQAVLVEGPCDATAWIDALTLPQTQPPVALMAYTQQPPVASILLPYAAYSPEYIALTWAARHKVLARFIDLPSAVFAGLQAAQSPEVTEEAQSYTPADLYAEIARRNGYDDYDTYWEATFEHSVTPDSYRQMTMALGEGLRALQPVSPENLVREAHMRREIQRVLDEGIASEKLVVVCGAFHAPALAQGEPLTDAELAQLPSRPTTMTIMPYSYLRLSSRTGYGAGNQSPRYFRLLWQALQDKPNELSTTFLTQVARELRLRGGLRSSAEVIEAVRLANGLAALRNQQLPTLSDLREAAVTCLGQGESAVVAEALNRVEIGTEIGSLPKNIARTAIQDDFYRSLKALKLERFHTVVAQDLTLDLRENRQRATELSRRLDLRRSFFLHRLVELGVSFARQRASTQRTATWKESYVLQWTPEAEIELVENALRGESVEGAAISALQATLQEAEHVGIIAQVIETACLCGLPSVLNDAQQALQAATLANDALPALADAVQALSHAIVYGDVRRMDTARLTALLTRLFTRAALTATIGCRCDVKTAPLLQTALQKVQQAANDHADIVDKALWHKTLREIADRDDLNQRLSGFATALLLEAHQMPEPTLEMLLSRRLSLGTATANAAHWFEGFTARNHYALLARPMIWRLLDEYIKALPQEDFMRILVLLRRALSAYSPAEKRGICDILGDLWHVDSAQVERALIQQLTEAETQALQQINDFDFSDF